MDSPLRICLLTDQELDSLPLEDDDWPADPRPYLPEAAWELGVLEKEEAVSRVVELSRQGFDLFFNLCDGAWDEGRVGIEVVQTLERLGCAFTGADSHFFEPSREAMKRVCHAWGIDTPGYRIARTAAEVEEAAEFLRFPLIVKHPSSYASAGLTPASRVEKVRDLRKRAEEAMARYGAALIEEFIEGLECTILVAENPDDPLAPTTYTPVQYRFPEGETFKHEQLKWVDYDGLEAHPMEDAELDTRVREMSARFFLGMRGAGYGRCDLRVDAEGRPYMLEINPNCGMYYEPDDYGSADLCLAHDPAGHVGFTRQVVAAALARHARRRAVSEVRPHPGGGYGLFARESIEAGEPVLLHRQQTRRVVSRAELEAGWPAPLRELAFRYGIPLTADRWLVWGEDPEEWRPVRHSCDPNAWWQGLDLVARRELAAGEEVTLDYATHAHEELPSFECGCGAAECRGIIRGSDALEGFVDRYQGHLTDYVRERRAGNSDLD